MNPETPSIISPLSGRRVLVVGDSMVDHYIWGRAERISPEAPVPVLAVDREEYRPGGAANVAANIAALGGEAVLLTAYGKDEAGLTLARLAERYGFFFEASLQREKVPTTRKTRVVAMTQQVVRVDWENGSPLDASEHETFMQRFHSIVGQCRAVVVSDYAKGLISDELCRNVIDSARRGGVPVVVDPKPPRVQAYSRATLVTPNRAEAELMLGRAFTSDAEVGEAALELRERLDLAAALVTQGGRGMTLALADGSSKRFPARAREVFDVSGAGDTVVSAAALALASDWNWDDLCELATVAAGLAVQKRGTAVVRWEEIADAAEWPE